MGVSLQAVTKESRHTGYCNVPTTVVIGGYSNLLNNTGMLMTIVHNVPCSEVYTV